MVLDQFFITGFAHGRAGRSDLALCAPCVVTALAAVYVVALDLLGCGCHPPPLHEVSPTVASLG